MRPSLRLSSFLAGFLMVGAIPFVPDALAQNAPVGDDTGAGEAAPAAPARDVRSWTTFKGDPQRTGNSAANVKLPLSLNWRFSSDAPSRTYVTSPLIIGAPGRQRAVFGAGRNVYSLDSQTGALVWKSPDLTSNVITPLTLLSGDSGDLIIVAQQGGRLAALRAIDGGRVWEVDALSSISNAGPILVNTAQGQRIVVAVGAGRLVAFNLDGTLDPKWQVTLGQYGISPTSSMSLSQDGNLIYICGSDSRLYAIDAQKGALAFPIQLAANSSVTPIVAGNQLIASNSRLVSAYKSSNGASLWNFDPRGEVIGSPSVGTDATGKNIVYFGTRNGSFYALDNAGGQKWKTEVGIGFTGSPVVLPTVVICGTANGLLIGLNPSSGAVIWQYRLKTDRAIQVQEQTGRGEGRGGRGGDSDGGRGGRRGGAGSGAGSGGTARNGQVRTWGVSSAPAAIDGQLLVFGDNAALYSFTTDLFDADPPRVVEPSLALPDDKNKIISLLLNNGNLQLPGRGPIYFAAQLEDTGSGVDPNSIKATLDDVAIAADAIDFQPSTGVLTVTLLDPLKGGTGLPDGLKNLTVTAMDYAGNPLQYSVGFLVDNTVAAPSAQVDLPAGQNDNPGETGGDTGDENGAIQNGAMQ